MSLPSFIDGLIYSARNYVAPTFFKKAGSSIPRWNYYSTFQRALNAYNYLTGRSSQDEPNAAGSINFTISGNETAGINCDFYVLYQGAWYPAAYKFFRTMNVSTCIVRFYTKSGSGPYYAVYDARFFGASATVTYIQGQEQQQALDELYREMALLKYRYNGLVSFINLLETRGGSPGILQQARTMQAQMSAQISTIQGVQIFYNKNGMIGLVPLLLIGAIVILAGATAWTVSKIITEKEKTKRINDAFDVARWVDQKMIEVSADPNLSSSEKNKMLNELNETKKAALSIANKSTKSDKGLFDNLADIVKWGVVGLIVYKGLDLAKSKQTANA